MKKELFILLIIMLFTFVGCGTKSSEENKEVVELQEPEKEEKEETNPLEEAMNATVIENDYYGRSLKNTIGFVSLNMDDEDFDTNEYVTILNDDESIWLEMPAGELGWALKDIEDFNPWLILFEVYHKIDFKCVGQDADYFYIVVNDEENVIKKLKKRTNPIFKSVEEYLQTMLVDSADDEANPMREGPGEDYPIAHFSDADLGECIAFNGKEVSGEWMRVQDIGNESVTGWVRWKENDTLILDLWYIL